MPDTTFSSERGFSCSACVCVLLVGTPWTTCLTLLLSHIWSFLIRLCSSLFSLASFLPLQLATSLGLSAVALSLPVTTAEAARGLVPPAAAGHFLGSAGSAVVLVMTFLAVTSSGASEQIAVSSIVGTSPSVSVNYHETSGVWEPAVVVWGGDFCTVADCVLCLLSV